jgi:hypothetical protein
MARCWLAIPTPISTSNQKKAPRPSTQALLTEQKFPGSSSGSNQGPTDCGMKAAAARAAALIKRRSAASTQGWNRLN